MLFRGLVCYFVLTRKMSLGTNPLADLLQLLEELWRRVVVATLRLDGLHYDPRHWVTSAVELVDELFNLQDGANLEQRTCCHSDLAYNVQLIHLTYIISHYDEH